MTAQLYESRIGAVTKSHLNEANRRGHEASFVPGGLG
jgi:hypothetical protein